MIRISSIIFFTSSLRCFLLFDKNFFKFYFFKFYYSFRYFIALHDLKCYD
nr:MAG TPA: hypothetical protein [Caudoviricetes sp.]